MFALWMASIILGTVLRILNAPAWVYFVTDSPLAVVTMFVVLKGEA